MTLTEMIERKNSRNSFDDIMKALYRKLSLVREESLHHYYSIEEIASVILYEMINGERYSADDIRRSIIMERLLRSINGSVNNRIVDELLKLCDESC